MKKNRRKKEQKITKNKNNNDNDNEAITTIPYYPCLEFLLPFLKIVTPTITIPLFYIILSYLIIKSYMVYKH